MHSNHGNHHGRHDFNVHYLNGKKFTKVRGLQSLSEIIMHCHKPVVDPGFPKGRCAKPERGRQFNIWQFFSDTAWKWRNFGPKMCPLLSFLLDSSTKNVLLEETTQTTIKLALNMEENKRINWTLNAWTSPVLFPATWTSPVLFPGTWTSPVLFPVTLCEHWIFSDSWLS